MNKAVTVAEVMTTDVVSLAAEQDVVFATMVMNLRRIRHLPVLRGETLVGMVSHRDLLRAQARFVKQLKEATDKTGDTTYASVLAEDVMTEEVRSVGPDMPAAEAAMILVDEKIGCLPVVNEGTLVGIATEADFLRWAVAALES